MQSWTENENFWKWNGAFRTSGGGPLLPENFHVEQSVPYVSRPEYPKKIWHNGAPLVIQKFCNDFSSLEGVWGYLTCNLDQSIIGKREDPGDEVQPDAFTVGTSCMGTYIVPTLPT